MLAGIKLKLTGKIVTLSLGVIAFIFYFILINLIINTAVNSLVNKGNISSDYNFVEQLELSSRDLMLNFRAFAGRVSQSKSYTQKSISKYASDDVIIVGIDEKSLSDIGKWPFKRSIHKRFTDYFTDSKYRENTLFFDIFFVEPDRVNPEDDFLLSESFKRNGRVVLDYLGVDSISSSDAQNADNKDKVDAYIGKFGKLSNVSGNLKMVPSFSQLSFPLKPYLDSIEATGGANSIVDNDKILRRYPMVLKYINNIDSSFVSIKENEFYDTLYFRNIKIERNDVTKTFEIKRYLEPIFEQSKSPLKDRRSITKSDIDGFKAKIDKFNNDIGVEINRARGWIKENNDSVISEVNRYLEKSNLDNEIKSQIKYVLNDGSNYFIIDDILLEILTNFEALKASDSSFIDEYKFFKKMCDKNYRMEKNSFSMFLGNESVKLSLYDIIALNKTYYFDNILMQREYYVPSITTVLASRYFHIPLENVEVTYGESVVFKSPMRRGEDGKLKVFSDVVVPIDEKGNMIVNYAGKASSTDDNASSTFITCSYSDIASGKKKILTDNKIIFVGAYSNGMADDFFQTPFKTMFGIEVIANSVNTVIKNNFVVILNSGIYILILLALAVLFAYISSLKNILRAFLYSVLALLLYFGLAFLVFVNFSVVLEVVKVILLFVITIIFVMIYRIVTEQRQKREIKKIFSKYVNSRVVEELLKHPPELGGQDMDITVQFSDIRGFTSLSESLAPQELVKILNRYLTIMSDIILEENGTLDKYIGDAIMCFWGAPQPLQNHAEYACRAALRQIEALKKLNLELPEGKKISIGIGLNSGIMTAGNVGSQGFMNYTIMGDNVNLGSRLEGTNKEYGTSIIISESTYEAVKGKFIARELDNIRVKGKTLPIKIYELLDFRQEEIK